MLVSILFDLKKSLGLQEFDFRSQNLQRVFDGMLRVGKIDDSYYSIAHEIRAIEMFSKMDLIKVYKDSRSEPGVDLEYRNNLVECVISTAGSDRNLGILRKSGYQQYDDIIDYNEKFRQISLRVLSSISSKRLKFCDDIRKGLYNEKQPFCIFLNLGSLSQEWFPGEYCKEATRFLVGRGHPRISINTLTGELNGGISYDYTPIIKNNNNSDVVTNVFGDPTNCCISAIIISSAELNELYTNKNTVVFTNPHAKNKIKVNDFRNFSYWRVYKKNEYVPRKNGKRLNTSGM